MAHGSGGKASHDLIQEVFAAAFDNPFLGALGDSAILPVGGGSLAFTTDTYVVKPPFFPGGDIGRLAVAGTVNDLAVMGAAPRFLSCGFVLEEALPLDTLRKVVGSMKSTADEAGVQIVAGDTKVVERGAADQIFINTCGVGELQSTRRLSDTPIRAGDRVLVSGTIGDHGAAVLCCREGLQFESEMVSDCAPLSGLIRLMLEGCDGIKFMRDPTRGGLATTLNEIVRGGPLGIILEEASIPVRDDVASFCEILGLDPLYVANEGKVVAVVEGGQAEGLCQIMRAHPLGREASIIGEVVTNPAGRVGLKTAVGGTRVVDMLVGDQLPRIC